MFLQRIQAMPLFAKTGATRVQKVDFWHSPAFENVLFTFTRGWAKIADLALPNP
jgi:hypothetical protein